VVLVQYFVNSVNVEFGPDRFGTPEGVLAWAAHRGFGTDPADGKHPEKLRRDALTLREGLRGLLREHNGADPDPAARQAVAGVAAAYPLVLDVSDDGVPVLRPVHPAGVRAALEEVLATVARTSSEGSFERLKACLDHRCEWAFYDRSRNRAGRWCSMAGCGTRSKMKVYRDGRRAPTAAAPG
jgi:predicted RNA-binding Zn ribbon-like protein